MTLNKQWYAGCHYAECHVLLNIMLSVVLLSVIELNVVAPKIHKENSESHDQISDKPFLEKNYDPKKF